MAKLVYPIEGECQPVTRCGPCHGSWWTKTTTAWRASRPAPSDHAIRTQRGRPRHSPRPPGAARYCRTSSS
jgi:hypothetical protein